EKCELSSTMSSIASIASQIKLEQERAEAGEREISCLLAELSKYEMANTDDYTAGIIDQQVIQQSKINDTRSSSLSTTQKTIKSLVDQTSAVYSTASHFVRVLSESVSYASEEIEKYRNRIGCLQRQREKKISGLEQKVTEQRLTMEGLCEKTAVNKETPTGLEKLTLLLKRMKLIYVPVILHIAYTKTSENLYRVIAQYESELERNRECLEHEKEYVRLQNARIIEEQNELDELSRKKAEAMEKHVQAQDSLEKLLAAQSASERKLSELKDEINSTDEKLSQLRASRSALEEQFNSESAEWERDVTIKKVLIYFVDIDIEFGPLMKATWGQTLYAFHAPYEQRDVNCIVQEECQAKCAELERQVISQQEELQLLNCQVEILEERFGDKSKWTKEEWQQALQEQRDEIERLNSEMTEYMVATQAMKKELSDNREEKSYEESVFALERDLLAFTERIALEKKIMQERRALVLSNLNCARERVAQQQESFSATRDEYEKLLSEMNSIQAQIEAFTSLRTPSKPVELGTTTGGSTRKSLTRRRKGTRRKVESDSDDGSTHSCIPEVEGLKPFSPATISLKQQKNNGSSCSRNTKAVLRDVRIENKIPVDVHDDEVQAANSKTTAAVFEGVESMQPTGQNNRKSSTVESESITSNGDYSPLCETLVSKRFPKDIFLRESPSIDAIDSAVSPNVSNGTFMETDSDQSIWSCASPRKPANTMDTTVDTDLDQSVW
ncbi:hypothetical protein GCK32_010675, partial [Trichostrongylus colubriformis]